MAESKTKGTISKNTERDAHASSNERKNNAPNTSSYSKPNLRKGGEAKYSPTSKTNAEKNNSICAPSNGKNLTSANDTKSDSKLGDKSSNTNESSKSPKHGMVVTPMVGCFATVAIPAAIVSVKPYDLKSIMEKDFLIVGDNQRKHGKQDYFRDNMTCYQLAINSWLLILTDTNWCASTSFVSYWTSEFSKRLLQYGLFRMIAEATLVADYLIAGIPLSKLPEGSGVGLWSWYMEETNNLYLSQGKSRERFVADMLQNLRYLKRFSPSGTTILERDSVRTFLSKEQEMYYLTLNWKREEDQRLIFRHTPSVQHVSLCEEIRGMSRGYTAGTEMCIREAREIVWSVLMDYNHDRAMNDDYCYFSSGNISDGQKNQADKFIAAGMKGPLTMGHFCVDHAVWRKLGSFEEIDYVSEISAVPKSYKAARIIAKEEAWRNYRMQGIRAELERCVEHRTNLRFKDQTPNQEAARLGSLERNLATLDLSSASDSVSRLLVEKLFPPHIYEDMDRFISKKAKLPSGGIKNLSKFSTSGTPLCFPTEEIVFYSIVVSATRRVGRWMGLDQDTIEDAVNHVIIFGDDMICEHWAAEHVIETLVLLGFTLNAEKSHWSQNDPYRESCGAEYWEGIDISSRYFPRKNITLPCNLSSFKRSENSHILALAILIDLQHKLATEKLRTANSYVSSCIRTLIPDMTESHIGSVYSDLWSEYPERFWDEFREPVTEFDTSNKYHNANNLQRDLEYHSIFVSEYEVNISERWKRSLIDLQEAGELLAYLQWLQNAPSKRTTFTYGGISFDIVDEAHVLKSYIGEPILRISKQRY